MNNSADLVDESPSALLWVNESDAYIDLVKKPDETTIYFGIFCLDKWHQQSVEKLGEVKAKLQDIINVWNRCYPWGNYAGIEIKVVAELNEAPFIFGSLCVEHHQEKEEPLVVFFLQDLSKGLDTDIFIKVCSSEGEVLLMECYDVLPSEYEYPKGNNRLWIHQGKFKFIPKDLAPHRGLRRHEALQFLTTSYYKLSEIPEVSSRLAERIGLGKSPEYHLESLVLLPLLLRNETFYRLVNENPRVISLALKNIYMNGQDPQEAATVNKFAVTKKCCSIKLLISKSQEKFLAGFLLDSGLDLESKNLPLVIGDIISTSLQELVSNNELDICQPSGETLDLLSGLKTNGFLKDGYELPEANFASAVKSDDKITDRETISRMQRLFSDIGTDLDSKKDAEGVKGDDSSEDDSENYADREALNYFKKEDIDIDEDDFFEYFLTEALKLKKDDLDDLRQEKSVFSASSPPDEEEAEMLAELEQLFGQKNGDSGEAIHQLLGSLKLDPSTGVDLGSFIDHIDSD
ncbi:LAME_0F12596g1_1 [Lachancea meyersii CBS 8951]|uniref:LAME_0F12596g1_1 n=1 Tax=Lachancea meyersii CBS 8951 TaxID=1266667 RepID=A0A1G4JWS2_9SACH|nr:LAME_0F12596g1_1 [Lachancea meyersii CBS 8951]